MPHRVHLRRPALRWAILWLALALPGGGMAQEFSEYSLKAVLYYRLAQFVYWPDDQPPPKPLQLCVVGSNPFGRALAQVDQRSGLARFSVAPGDLSQCQMIFIPRSEADKLQTWLDAAGQHPIMTVSDIPGFAHAGGMIELPLDGERINIVINRRSAQKRGFQFNAQLLRLARVVE